MTAHGADGGTLTKPISLQIEHLFVVSMGDSMAAGEGNPDRPRTKADLGWIPAGWQHKACHRSAHTGHLAAAQAIRPAGQGPSLAFLSLACTGAGISDLSTDRHNGQAPQLDDVLVNKSGKFRQSLPIDFTTVAPGPKKTFSVQTTAAAPAGTYNLYLALPDPDGSLSANPAYDLQLANSNMSWTSPGYNGLSAPIRVDPAD